MTFANLARMLAVLPLALVLTQCDKVRDLLKPKPSPYAFDVKLRVSPKGEEALKNSKGFYIKASYYGIAKPDYRAKADRMNRLYLGDESWTYSGDARSIHLKGEPIDESVLPHTTDGQPYVLLSIKGLTGGPDDVDQLTCHTFIGPIRQAQEQPQTLDCEFESEGYWAKANAVSSSQ